MTNSVTCSHFESRVQDLMDQRIRLESDDGIRQHAAICRGCREQLGRFIELEVALRSLFSDAEDDSMTADGLLTPPTVDSMLVDGAGSTRKRLWTVASLIAAASVLFILPVLTQPDRPVADLDNAHLSTSSGVVAPFSNAGEHGDERAPSVRRASSSGVPVYSQISNPIRSACQYASELPGVRPLEYSVNVTLEVIQQSLRPFSKSSPSKEPHDDLGQRAELYAQLA